MVPLSSKFRPSDVLQQAALEGMKKELDTMLPRVQQVVSQTRARILKGVTNSAGKIVSLFEYTTEIIHKHSCPTQHLLRVTAPIS